MLLVMLQGKNLFLRSRLCMMLRKKALSFTLLRYVTSHFVVVYIFIVVVYILVEEIRRLELLKCQV